MHGETCDACGQKYDFTREQARLAIYLEDVDCTHIQAICPNCKNQERIFCRSDVALKVMDDCKLTLTLAPRAPADLKASAARCWGVPAEPAAVVVGSEQTEVPVPREWVAELYDDLRNWKGVI